jgi:hypothetical protein
MESHYNNLNKKLDKLQKEKTNKREKMQPRNQQFHYHARTVNLTNIKFTQEMSLLNNGLQYSIETPLKKYKTDLIIETEQVIRLLDNKLQAHFRILAAKKMKQIIASDSQNIAVKRQNYILNNINRKHVE